jgi:hypothetical protein
MHWIAEFLQCLLVMKPVVAINAGRKKAGVLIVIVLSALK